MGTLTIGDSRAFYLLGNEILNHTAAAIFGRMTSGVLQSTCRSLSLIARLILLHKKKQHKTSATKTLHNWLLPSFQQIGSHEGGGDGGNWWKSDRSWQA